MSASTRSPIPGDCTIRPLARHEVATLIDWAADEGWNPGLDDADAFHAADPGGFIGAFVAGRLVAGISAVAYGPAFGFIGLYLCDPDRRSQGYGKAAWNAGMARLAGRTIGLDGVDAQRENYRRKGFAAAYRTTRYSGSAGSARDRTSASATIVPVATPVAPALGAFDRAAFGAPRDAFAAQWFAAPRIALIDRDHDTVRGCVVVRRCRDGWKIGPLFARETEVAIALLEAVCARVDSADVVNLDVPASNPAFARHLVANGFTPGFETTRMYHGTPPASDPALVFAVTTLELG